MAAVGTWKEAEATSARFYLLNLILAITVAPLSLSTVPLRSHCTLTEELLKIGDNKCAFKTWNSVHQPPCPHVVTAPSFTSLCDYKNKKQMATPTLGWGALKWPNKSWDQLFPHPSRGEIIPRNTEKRNRVNALKEISLVGTELGA